MTPDLLLAILLALPDPGTTQLAPELKAPWSNAVIHEAPTADPRASALRFYNVDDGRTVRCELRFNPVGFPQDPELARLHVVAHELGHCFDERAAPAGVDENTWKELYADVWGALALKGAGRDATGLLRTRSTLRPYLVKILAELRAAPESTDTLTITQIAYDIRDRIFAPS